MPFRISAKIRSSLPEDERTDLEDFLLSESGGKCYLCRGDVNIAADTLVADHDDPTAEDGPASRANLHLAHWSCNSFKRAQPTIEVRPFLQLRREIEELGGLVHYGAVLPKLAIAPGKTAYTDHGGMIEFAFADGSKRKASVFEDPNGSPTYRYAFVDVPRVAIHNDNECQPRSIKPTQLWKIYSDIQRNPLHEPPSVRLMPGTTANGGGELWLFDGQHKTLACWLDGWERVVVKVYLNIDLEGTIALVNSIQATIPKLPLSTFELTRKMDEETRLKLERYLKEKDAAATEEGFMRWLDPGERTRGRQGFRLALVNGLLQSDELEMLRYVQKAGAPSSRERSEITETAFRSKVLEPLLHRTPLTEPWAEATVLREREASTIVRLLNLLTKHVLDIDSDDDVQVESRRRLLYQSALSYVTAILRRTVGMILRSSEGREFLDKEPDEKEWAEITKAVERLAAHPIWTATFDTTEVTERVRKVRDALSMNQDAEQVFRDVGLTPGYLMGDKLPPHWDGSDAGVVA